MELISIQLFFLTFGLLIGSFLNAVIYRVPRKVSIVKPRSSCTHCKKIIYWYENIPIMSYLFLRGKCSNCQTKISLEYPSIELFCGLVSLGMAPHLLTYSSLLSFLFYFSVFAVLLCLFMIDLKHKLLPNSLNLLLLILLLPVAIETKGWRFCLLGGLVGFGFPFLLTWLFYIIKGKIGLGGGDIKLFGILGLYLGVQGIVINLFLSSMIGSVIGLFYIIVFKADKKEPIPFGPFIILVSYFQIFFVNEFKEMTNFLLGV